MATSKKYLSLEEAASLLKIKTEELIRFREKGDIRGFADRGTWKFKAGDVEEFARRRQPDSDPDVGIIDDDVNDAGSANPMSAMDEDDDEVGRQATVIRKGVPPESDSNVRLFGDSVKKSDQEGANRGLSGAGLGQSDSDVRLVDSDLPPVDSVIQLADSEVLFSGSEIQFTQSEVQLFGGRGHQRESDSDSDVKLVNLLGSPAESDSDVKLIDEPKRRLKDSDSDVKLAKSDSDVKIVKTHDSDSDVQLIDQNKKRLSDSDSDVKLMLSDSDSDVKLINQRAAIETASDSDVAILPASPKGRGKSTYDNEPASALYDDDPGITLPGDSGIQLSGDSGIQLGVDSGLRLTGDSGIRLAGDSPIRMSDDSGIQLQQPADSGILLEGADSGLTLDHRGDSGIRLSDDSGMKLLSGSSKNLRGGSSKNLKGRSAKQDSLDLTAPMLSTRDDRSDDELSATAPMLLGDDDLSDDDLQVPLLSDDTAAETNVIMFEDDESDQTSATVVKKGRKSVDESAFDLGDDEESVDDELEVSDDVLGEDDELEDLDAFASDEDEFDENFESGASRIGFGAPAGKISAPQEVEWSTGYFISLIASTLVLLVGAIVSADLLKTTWAAGDPSVYQGELLDSIGGLYK